ncbi:BamA/TamA family outer membrane protein [Ginsengibacter hankyongi]|uniref:BamA/TamA family outer membrane protein n=1 Tax=Ginsengibacter hankyongi TaxID=2607284 RepID=A0A5J5IIB3_9BACT|nr:BamA/TamA family outer membrane protein [Ginsengibacter hankyongi]KAA9040656.1 BamA/TamA family outer membrane protein [Ginsengibacter hankyongi]
MINKRYQAILLIGMLFMGACNPTKLVPKGDALYTGATIKVDDSTLSKKEKNKIVDLTEHVPRPIPNSRFLGVPLKLLFYNLAGNPKKTKGFLRKFFRNIGEPPVLLSSVNVDYNSKVLQNYLENIGYFHAQASGDTIVKRKRAHATYTLTPGPVYTIQNVSFQTDSSSLGRTIQETRSTSLLKSGDHFNLEVIKNERDRIDAILKEQGYYYFSPELLIVNADSTIGNNKVNMYLQVKEKTPALARKPYIIDNVYIYPNYRLNAKSSDTSHLNESLYEGYYIVDPLKKFKPQLFPRIMMFDSGDVYSRTAHNLTLSRLINLDVFKFVKNRFEDSPNSQGDTGRLNTYYYLTPSPKKSLRAEISGNTKSNNYVGSLITVTYKNRNIFRGAEHLDLHANVGSEVQYSGYQSGYNTYRLGGGLTFTIPKFVVPFFKFNTTNAFVPSTKMDLSYDLLTRLKLYTLSSFTSQLGYSWKPNIKVQQDFNPFAINYVRAIKITQKYLDSIKSNPILKHAVDTQFVIGSNYSYTVDPLINNPYGSGFYFNGLADLSGNISGLLIKADPADGKKKLFGAPISQYIKTQLEGRYYYAFTPKIRLANRMIIGFGYPYGNSTELPFIKQFFIGGNNSVRAFRSRSVGPGTYRDPKADSLTFFPDESGDIKLEMNTELRYKINNILEGAFFVDAGNIWLYNKDIHRPGGEFTKDFLNQLAVGTGVGLRLNLTILLLRIDLATPLRDPWLPQGSRWVINKINFRNRDWRRKNLVLNLAIGYPF